MRNAAKSKSCSAKACYQSSASVVDGKLILTFPNAKTPVVWQMDLTQTKASALEVRDNEGVFTLTLKTPKGENLDIAPFEKREDAVQGLMAAAHALENSHGQIRPGEPANSTAPLGYAQTQYRPANSTKPSSAGRWAGALLGIFLLLILLSFWSMISSVPPKSDESAAVAGGGKNESGVPLSADDFLKKK